MGRVFPTSMLYVPISLSFTTLPPVLFIPFRNPIEKKPSHPSQSLYLQGICSITPVPFMPFTRPIQNPKEACSLVEKASGTAQRQKWDVLFIRVEPTLGIERIQFNASPATFAAMKPKVMALADTA